MTTETDRHAKAEEIANHLAMFIGGGDQFGHWTGRIRFTEGVRYLADKAGAYWLIDAIVSYQASKAIRKNPRLAFQLWRLQVADGAAVLDCREDSDCKPAIRQEIEYTDFPLDEIELYVCDRVLMLKNEY